MSIKQIVMIGLFSAIAFILQTFVFFKMPQGGSISFYFVPLLIAAFNFDFKTNFFIAIIASTLHIILGGFVLNPVQVLLDYYLPTILICTCASYRINKYAAISIAGVLSLLSYTISGMIFFETPFVASLVYNATHFIPSIILCTIIFAIINPRLKNTLSTVSKKSFSK